MTVVINMHKTSFNICHHDYEGVMLVFYTAPQVKCHRMSKVEYRVIWIYVI